MKKPEMKTKNVYRKPQIRIVDLEEEDSILNSSFIDVDGDKEYNGNMKSNKRDNLWGDNQWGDNNLWK